MTLAIPGDSGPCEGLTALCRDADVAVVECSMPDLMPIAGHMNPTTLAELIRASNLKHLVVTHQYPAAIAMDAVGALRAMVDVEISVPDDGETFELNGP
ncbi:MAG: ribonuclease BN (tRNA processing enzyme) [Bradymonadia bacterium]|jgi:ribonuclease BN (tRNA processing enzyme)